MRCEMPMDIQAEVLKSQWRIYGKNHYNIVKQLASNKNKWKKNKTKTEKKEKINTIKKRVSGYACLESKVIEIIHFRSSWALWFLWRLSIF